MKKVLLFIVLSCHAMQKPETVIEIKESQDVSNIACECKLCKGIKIAIATNVLSIAITAGATMLINYSQCYK